ncbi:MAG: DUF3052 family protein [Chloroflexales bacterium]|nr:DUF3052 family protein [Chloroflexales bacterium]
MVTGYSGTPLQKKLGLKPGIVGAVINPPPHYWELLGPLPEHIELRPLAAGDLDWVHLFVTSRDALADAIVEARARIRPNGAIWVSWPKRAAKVPSDITEDVIRDMALAANLVDVKVCTVDATWSGLKLVIPVRHRV